MHVVNAGLMRFLRETCKLWGTGVYLLKYFIQAVWNLWFCCALDKASNKHRCLNKDTQKTIPKMAEECIFNIFQWGSPTSWKKMDEDHDSHGISPWKLKKHSAKIQVVTQGHAYPDQEVHAYTFMTWILILCVFLLTFVLSNFSSAICVRYSCPCILYWQLG